MISKICQVYLGLVLVLRIFVLFRGGAETLKSTRQIKFSTEVPIKKVRWNERENELTKVGNGAGVKGIAVFPPR